MIKTAKGDITKIKVQAIVNTANYKALKSYKSGFLEELLCIIVKSYAPFETPLTIIPLKSA